MPAIPPTIERTTPEIDIASPPHSSGNMLPAVEPTKKPIQTNFFVIVSCGLAATTLTGFGFPGLSTFSVLRPTHSRGSTRLKYARDESSRLQRWPATSQLRG